MRALRLPLVAALVAASAMAAAGVYTIRLSPFPAVEVADGHSQVVVTAQVYEDGRLVGDGTQVVFESTLGAFRETVVRTSSGVARGILIAGGVPGTARIKASVVAGDATGSTCEIEFVKSREELSQARETIEATTSAAGSLNYANDSKIIEATAPDKGAVVRYRDFEVHADVLQLDLQNFTLKARKAVVKRGRQTISYDAFFLNLTDRTGYGLTNYPTRRPDSITLYPGGLAFVETGGEGDPVVAAPRMRYGLVEVGRDRDRPLDVPLNDDPFEMADLSGAPSSVGAKRAVVVARREIQFHRADVYVNNAKVLKFPSLLVQINSDSGSPLVTDDFVSVNDNQIALNYPYHLSLKPGFSSLLRFRTGERYGQSLSASRGAFLDYELSWSKGDDQQGGFIFSGMGRTDWVASLRQYWRMDSRSTASFQIDSPGGKSIGGSGSVGRSFGQYNLSLNGSQSQTLNGPTASRYGSQYYGLNFDRNPVKVPGTHVRTSYGLTANQSSTNFFTYDPATKQYRETTNSQSGIGFSARAFTDSIPLDRLTSMNASAGLTQLYGPNARYNGGLALTGTMTLTRRLGEGTNVALVYNYVQDGINETILGRNSLSLSGTFFRGNTGLRFSASKGIGVERMNLSSEASYRLSSLWRLSYTHLLNTYGFAGGRDSFSEFFAIVSYRIGWREIGLTWSSRTKRPGIQLMNSSF